MNRWNQTNRFHTLKRLAGEHRTAGELAGVFCGSTAFRFSLLAIAIYGATFAVRTSDAFQSAQFAALKAETMEKVASAASLSDTALAPKTDIMGAEPRLLKTVALQRKPAEASADPATDKPKSQAGIASSADLCKAFGNARWADSALFADQKECMENSAGDGYKISQVARGAGADRIDTIRLKLKVADETVSAKAGEALETELSEALKVAQANTPSRFLESVSKLEAARAEAGDLAFRFEPDVANANQYTLVVESVEDADKRQRVRFRP